MNKLALLVVFALVCDVIYGDKLIVARARRSDDGLIFAKSLSSLGFKVHGHYGDMVVLSSSDKIPTISIPHVHFRTVDQHVHSELAYFVLERQEREYASPLVVDNEYMTILYSSFNRIVVSTPKVNIPKFETTIPSDLEIIPIDVEQTIHFGIRSSLLPIVTAVYANASKFAMAPHPAITAYVNQVSGDTLSAFVTHLTGEDPKSTIKTRNSRSQGAKDASAWIAEQFQNFGLNVSTQQFRTDYSSNVIGVKLGKDSSKVVVVGAHYDSRGPDSSSMTDPAPGANDNGSGSGAILQIAKIFHDSKAEFSYTIHFILYSGEEQGLYGSAAYAQHLLDTSTSVVGVFNADMLAFRATGEATQCAFPSRYSTPELEVLARTATVTYVPQLTIGITTACCSDHQSYYNRGIPATGFFERNGAIADNQYHKALDLVGRTGFDVPGQYTQLVKAVLASVATLAGPVA